MVQASTSHRQSARGATSRHTSAVQRQGELKRGAVGYVWPWPTVGHRGLRWIERQIDSPMPMPSGFVVKKGVEQPGGNVRLDSDAESSTVNEHLIGPVHARWIRSSRSRIFHRTHGLNAHSLEDSIITCCSWVRSPSTGGSDTRGRATELHHDVDFRRISAMTSSMT